jgi:hypothetical protein
LRKHQFPSSDLPEMMLIVLVVWLCSLILIGPLVTPFFGVQAGMVTTAALLVTPLALRPAATIAFALRRVGCCPPHALTEQPRLLAWRGWREMAMLAGAQFKDPIPRGFALQAPVPSRGTPLE